MSKFNVSHIRTHLECPAKARYEHELRRVPLLLQAAPELGTCWHKAIETDLKTGGDKVAALKAADDYLLNMLAGSAGAVTPAYGAIVKKIIDGWKALEPALMAWKKPEDWEVVHVEKQFNVALTLSPMSDGFAAPELQFTVDALVKWNGLYWHLQHKTLAPGIPLSVYYASMQRDWHECLYQYGLIQLGYAPYGGTMLNVVRKLSAKTIAENPSAALSIQYIPRSDDLVEKARQDFLRITNDIRRQRPLPAPQVIQNRSACSGPYRNSLCAYINVCNGVASIDDESDFKTAPDRYA